MLTTSPLRWTQEQAIAYECARECLTDLMAICMGELASEQARAPRIEALERELFALGRERQALGVHDADRVAEIRLEYGAWIAAWRGVRAWRDSARDLVAARYPALASAAAT